MTRMTLLTLRRPSLRRPDLPSLILDTSAATWKGRAVRYVLIYVALTVALVGVRYATQDIRPTLRAAQGREAALTTLRDDLAVQVQALETPQRVRDQALAGDMQRFAQSPKTVQAISPPPPAAQPRPVPARTVEVKTEWK